MKKFLKLLKPKKRLIFALAILTMFYSCNKDDNLDENLESTNQEKGYGTPYIGAGYGWDPAGNSGDGRFYQSPFPLSLIQQTNTFPAEFRNKTEANIATIETVEDFYEYAGRVRGLDDAYFRNGYFSISVDRDADILSALNIEKDYISVVVTVDAVGTKFDVAGNPDFRQLKEEAKDVAQYPELWRERYGDLYVNSEINGGSFTIVYNWERSLLSEFQKSKIKTGFGLRILNVFGLGYTSTVSKTEADSLIREASNIRLISTVSNFDPSLDVEDISTYNNTVSRFLNLVESDPLKTEIMYQKLSPYSPYIELGSYHIDPDKARSCLDLNKQWTHVFNVMDLINDKTPNSDRNKSAVRALRNRAKSNRDKARACVNGSVPPAVNNNEVKPYLDAWEYLKRGKAMMRFYDLVGKTYFYTYNDTEIRNLRRQPSRYRDEGLAFHILDSPIPGKPTVSLKRFKTVVGSKITFFYTTSRSEGDRFGTYEGEVGYVLDRQRDGSVPLFRLRNADTYFYTTGDPKVRGSEGYNAVKNYGYTAEGVACQVFK